MKIRNCQNAGCVPEVTTWIGDHVVSCDCYDGPDDDGHVFQCHHGRTREEAIENWNEAQQELEDEGYKPGEAS